MSKCKHENADHVGPDPTRFSRAERHAVEHLVCLDCGEWLSLGPSNDDTDEARIAIRAAEMTVPVHSCADESMMAWAGRRHYVEGHDDFPRGSFDALAGYLAQAIDWHDSHSASTAGGGE